MCFILQVLLFAGASATNYLVTDVWHGPPSLGILAEFIFLAAAWFGYVLYQVRHPDWWPPWDEGLPQGMRMLNAFVPVAILLTLVLILTPIFQATRQKALQHRLRVQQKHRTSRVSDALQTEPLDFGLQRRIVSQDIRPWQYGT